MDGLNLTQVKHCVVMPALNHLGGAYVSASAINMLTGIMQVESGGVYLQQLGGGPAVGLWQMEPFTHDDCWNTFLNYPAQAELRAKVQSLVTGINGPGSPAYEMEGNLYYACAMARVKLLRCPPPLPAPDDAQSMANYHKTWYNTAAGKADPTLDVQAFQAAIDA